MLETIFETPNLIRTFPREWKFRFREREIPRPRGFVKPGFFRGYRFLRTTWRKLNFSEECPGKCERVGCSPRRKYWRGRRGETPPVPERPPAKRVQNPFNRAKLDANRTRDGPAGATSWKSWNYKNFRFLSGWHVTRRFVLK